MTEQKNVQVSENNVWTTGVWFLVAGLIVGFLVGWYWQKNVSQEKYNDELLGDTTSTGLIASTSTAPVPGTVYEKVSADASVSVLDQKAGNLVFIQHANVTVPTWIAVREIINGAVGNILGAEMVTSKTDDVPVTLLRSTKAGEKYAVFLYQDDGNGEFDFKKDLLVMNSDTPASAVFVAQ